MGGENPYEKLLPIKLRLAEYYSNKKCFLLDLKLVAITIISIIFPKFASTFLGINKLCVEIPELKDFVEHYL